jgi:hypothetical protein
MERPAIEAATVAVHHCIHPSARAQKMLGTPPGSWQKGLHGVESRGGAALVIFTPLDLHED